ncbi:acyl-CoA dehydrogenase family protein [Rhizorhabdus sp.]|jgi:alkylation response protein AidB-like acyl-CoA dehydrogenase|uniref:acyl-CoA dehydrogenase family protein n=1 Tax=Rhizorhabdus sp. TaxID=1968843 RepID=UPI0019B787A0|nr:acyl-CoA dehydrogenase family protein [Rhizorhabdus sp.]MBD3761646.1 acyl-CoA dehydrogenase family protein [Rhizorhabdus sp.]
MRLGYDDADLAFREEVRAFLRTNLPADLATAESRSGHLRRAQTDSWQKVLAAKGWAVPNWPEECGGTGWSPLQRHIYEVEYGRANAPEYNIIGVGLVGPVICRFSDESQKARFVRPIIEGDIHFCQGFSEPGAGSDLASVKTKAVQHSDHFIVTGQKTWTSHAVDADYMICLARTNSDVKPQAGLSMLIIPMDAPGVQIRPIASIDGINSINEVYLDDVRVPVEDLVGERDKGWTYAKYLLNTERTHNAYLGILYRYLDRLRQFEDRSASFERRLEQLAIDIEAHDWSVLRVHSNDNPELGGATASAIKVRASDLLLRAAELEVEALGLSGVVETRHNGATLPAWAPSEAEGKINQLMYWRASTIFGGANEVQRAIIWATLSR